MKKILSIILFMTLPIIAQVNGYNVGNGSVWSDSLWYGKTVARDSAAIYNMNFSKTWFTIYLKGNTNNPVDSLKIMLGTIRYNERKEAIDTLWGSFAPLKDSTLTYKNVLINNTVGKSYILDYPGVQLLKIQLMNYRPSGLTRKVKYAIQAK